MSKQLPNPVESSNLSELPLSDIVALHAFSYFISLENQLEFFQSGKGSIGEGFMSSTLSIGENGHITENSDVAHSIELNLTFNIEKFENKMEQHKDEKGTPFTHDDYTMFFVDSMYEQITPQIYAQTLKSKKDLSLFKDNALVELETRSQYFEMSMYDVYLKIMMPLISNSTTQPVH